VTISSAGSELLGTPGPLVTVTSDMWISELGLFVRDLRILQATDWLNDNIIQAAHSVLKNEFGDNISGWQSPQLIKRPQCFKKISDREPFIQILHENNSHWIVVSNMPFKRDSNNIYIYDSLNSGSINNNLVNTTCCFFKCKYDSLHFDVVNVSKQSNHYDCGVLAIAYATELAHGEDPAKYDWSNALIRKHLINCLEKKKMERFPQSKTRTLRLGQRILKTKMIKLFCECRMAKDESKAMIQCSSSKKLFHIDCVSPKTCIQSWVCVKCLEILTPPQL